MEELKIDIEKLHPETGDVFIIRSSKSDSNEIVKNAVKKIFDVYDSRKVACLILVDDVSIEKASTEKLVEVRDKLNKVIAKRVSKNEMIVNSKIEV